MSTAQLKAQANFKKAIAYRKKTGCTLKQAFAYVKGSKVNGLDKVIKKGNKTSVFYTKKVKKKAAPKKKVSQGVLFGVKNKAKPYKLIYDRSVYNKLLQQYDKTGALLDDAITIKEKSKLKKELDRLENKLNRYERNSSSPKKITGMKKPIKNTHKDTNSHNVNIKVVSGIGDIGENFTRVNNDVNGNPRYVIHFLDVINTEERISIPFTKLYEYALKKAKKIGGRKYNNKSYGGGIVFQSYNIENTWKKIQELKNTTPKIKI